MLPHLRLNGILKYTLDDILLLRYIVFVAWEVEVSDEFRAWYEDLDEDEVESVNYSVGLLEEAGPILGRPHVDLVQQVTASKYEGIASSAPR